MAVDARIAVLLTKVDWRTLHEAIEKHDTDVIKIDDGSAPTREQLALIMKAGTDDFAAAKDLLHRYLADAREQADVTQRLAELIGKYATHPDETTGEIVPRMTAEDRAEFLRLAAVFS